MKKSLLFIFLAAIVLAGCSNQVEKETKSSFELRKEVDCVDRCSGREDFTTCNYACNREVSKPIESTTGTECIDTCNKTYTTIFDTEYKKCISACN